MSDVPTMPDQPQRPNYTPYQQAPSVQTPLTQFPGAQAQNAQFPGAPAPGAPTPDWQFQAGQFQAGQAPAGQFQAGQFQAGQAPGAHSFGAQSGGAALPPSWQHQPPAGAGSYAAPSYTYAAPTVAVERLGRGLALSLLAIPVAVAITAVLAKLGFIAAISSVVLGGLAVFLYSKGAGTAPKRGLIPLIGVVLGGLVLCFLSIIAVDAATFAASDEGQSLGMSTGELVARALTTPEVYAGYGRDALMFVAFAALGLFSVLRRRR